MSTANSFNTYVRKVVLKVGTDYQLLVLAEVVRMAQKADLIISCHKSVMFDDMLVTLEEAPSWTG